VGVDIADVPGLQRRGFQRLSHRGSLAFDRGSRDVRGIGAKAVARELGVDAGATVLRALPVFQHYDGSAFAQHQSGSILRKGLARGGRIPRVFARERLQGIPGDERAVRQRRLRAPGKHHIDFAGTDSPRGLPDRHCG